MLEKVKIAAERSASAYRIKKYFKPGSPFAKMPGSHFFESENISGYVSATIIDSTQYILIAFTGTNGLRDMLDNLRFSQTKLGIHQGWYRAYRSVKKQIDEILKHFDEGIPIIATGHSMGGALACIMGLFYGRNREVTLITFGAPKFGNQKVCDRLKIVVAKHWRIEHYLDTIPFFPLGNFAVGGTEKKVWWWGNPHGIEGYTNWVRRSLPAG